MFTLKPSKIEGIGVFTNSPIKKGESLDIFDEDDTRLFVPKNEEEKELCNRFGVPEGDKYWMPMKLNRFSMGWYLNHSDDPNTEHIDYRYIARKDIESGEELTLDYKTLT